MSLTKIAYAGWGRHAAYGLPAFALAALTFPVQALLPAFYADDMGLGLSAVGLALMLARVWDVLTDPLAGIVSDKLRDKGRFGRAAMMAAGMPLVLLGAYFVLMPQPGAGFSYLLFWMAALYLGWTIVIVPYYALGAEQGGDSHARTLVSAWRENFVILGIVVSLLLLPAAGGSVEGALRALFFLLLATLPAALFVMARYAPGKTGDGRTGATNDSGLSGQLLVLAKNRPFRLLAGAYFLNALANALPASLFLLYAGHVLEAKDQAGPLLLVYFFCGVVSIPLWTMLSRRWGKKRAWQAAMLLAALFFLASAFLRAGDLPWFFLICVMTGLCLGGDLVLAPALQADIVEADRQSSGQSRAGLFFSVWTMLTKLALALAVGIFFPLMAFLGVDLQNGGNIAVIAVFYGAVPVLVKLIAVALLQKFSVP